MDGKHLSGNQGTDSVVSRSCLSKAIFEAAHLERLRTPREPSLSD